MFSLNPECRKCGEGVGKGDKYVYVHDWDSPNGARYWRHACADFETPMTDERRPGWNTWKLQQAAEANAGELDSMRSRTAALRGQVMDLMRRAGCLESEIDDFDYEYGFREKPREGSEPGC